MRFLSGKLSKFISPGFDRGTTPVINGRIQLLSADRIEDPRTGVEYYTARITIPELERNRLGKLKLLPGLPIEIFAKTDERRVLSYLTKPLTDQLALSFR